jgi:hypothetical protein
MPAERHSAPLKAKGKWHYQKEERLQAKLLHTDLKELNERIQQHIFISRTGCTRKKRRWEDVVAG